MPVTWHFLVRRLSTSSIGMIPLASIPFCVALTDQVHMFTKDIRAGGAILCPIVLGWKLCLSALISFVCARDPRCFSDLITGVGQCRTFFPWTGFCCRLIWWLVLLPEVLVFFSYCSIRFTFFGLSTGIVLPSFYMLWALLWDADRACFCLSLILQPIVVFIVLLWSYTCSCFPCF